MVAGVGLFKKWEKGREVKHFVDKGRATLEREKATEEKEKKREKVGPG